MRPALKTINDELRRLGHDLTWKKATPAFIFEGRRKQLARPASQLAEGEQFDVGAVDCRNTTG
jgi:hypothetical protein